jgi:diguanylate cyclase (GGDEF)-like protein
MSSLGCSGHPELARGVHGPLSPHAALGRGLVWAMGLLLAAAVIGSLVLHGDARQVVVDGLGMLAVWISSGVCWLAAWRVGFRRWEVLLAAAAVTSFAAGLTYIGAVVASGGSVPSPSPADVPYILFYPLMLAALFVAVRHHLRGLASSVWLDCAVGSLGAASVVVVVLSPVLDSAATGSSWLATALAVAYPMLDLLLVAAVAGIAALRGVWMGRRWGLLVAGLMAFAATDVVYALQRATGNFVPGTPLDAGWGIGLALVAMWVNGTTHHDRRATQQTRPATGARALGVSSVATVAGLGVLLVGTWVPLSRLAETLAGVTLLAAVARSQLAFRLLARMADLRRLTAATDELTGLANRRALYAEGYVRLLEPQGRRQALLMLDLDKFKEVNDSLGHHAGDQLLIHVGARLREHLRAEDLLVRLGGDEFAVLLQDAGHDEAVDVAVKLCAALAAPFALEDITLHSSVSVGIALFPEHGLDLGALLRKADIAMYKAKTSGHGHHVYNCVDDADDTTRLQTVQELRTALTTDQVVVHYQPKIDLDTGEVHAVEALVRWNHPTRGLLHPDAFLNLVEDSGLMPSMTRIVLAQALDQAANWHRQGQPLTVAVNLSASSLVDSDLPRQIASMLAARGVPPCALQLEITEEFLMADRDQARAILTRLRHIGIQISIDDYGTGYSSLSYLRDLPIDELKLDRSFILPMADDVRAAALVASTIALAHSLGMRMVAEGVETHVAYTELAGLGCDQAQGYFMSRPVPAAELDHWLSNRRGADILTDIPQLRTATPVGHGEGR